MIAMDKKIKQHCKHCVHYEKNVKLEPCKSCEKVVTVKMTNRQGPWDNLLPMLW